MLLSIHLDYKFEIPGLRFPLEELLTQREGLWLNYQQPPPKKRSKQKCSLCQRQKKKEKKKVETLEGMRTSPASNGWQHSPAPIPNPRWSSGSSGWQEVLLEWTNVMPSLLCSTSLPSCTGKSCAQHSPKYDESNKSSSEKVVFIHRMPAKAACNLCVSFNALDTRGKRNEGY